MSSRQLNFAHNISAFALTLSVIPNLLAGGMGRCVIKIVKCHKIKKFKENRPENYHVRDTTAIWSSQVEGHGSGLDGAIGRLHLGPPIINETRGRRLHLQ